MRCSSEQPNPSYPQSLPLPPSLPSSSSPQSLPRPPSLQSCSSPQSLPRPPSLHSSSTPRSLPRLPSLQSSATTKSLPRPASLPSSSPLRPLPRPPATKPSSFLRVDLPRLPDIRLEVGRLLNIFPVYPPRQCYELKLFHLLLMQATPRRLNPSPFAPDITLPALFNQDLSTSPSRSNSSRSAPVKNPRTRDFTSKIQKECAKISVIKVKGRIRKRKATIGTTQREVLITPVCSDGYSGGDGLRETLWDHAQDFVAPILQKLKPGIGQNGVKERVILGIVTKRVFGRVVVRVTGEEEEGNIWLGGIDESAGVLGIHLVVFGCEVREGRAKLWKLPKVQGMNIPELKDGEGRECRMGEWLRGMEGAWGEWKTIQMNMCEESDVRA
eukprot:GFKZ01009133.1.p1 GENE.GFKZ01009133.1~~GFKZ01009133.1.p1  ORF type:complete len:384 (+),score=40.72 GFKZ01009133.1:3304-4455(+)